ncbi:hypothetical protein [Natronorubrum sp. FCH18a]|uniref:hypothetical protein n=1 Tax=Natronorubrum sp. FCH18a TaxID=3447018 RepID=UPI003F50F2A4
MIDMVEFREFERDYSLFNLKIDGVPIWERLRFSTYQEIKQQSGTGQAHTSVNLDNNDHVKGAKIWLRNLFHRNPFLTSKSDVIFVGHQRRKKKLDGYWWDIYCDPIHEEGSLNSVHFEKPYLLKHRTPAKTESLRYLEFIIYGGTIQRKLGLHNITLSPEEKDYLNDVQEGIHQRFNTEIKLSNKVQRLLRNRRCRLWLYKRLLDKIDPEVAVVVVSYGKHMFIEACKQKGIPVIELQHGVIYPDHLGYSYSGDRTKTTFPDYLLTWGEFWGKDIEFPIPDNRVIPVGYPHLDQSTNQYENVRPRDQILFISQGTIGKQLSKFAMELDQHPGVDYKIVYKLHPGEYDRWETEYPWLLEADFEIIDNSDRQLYKLFAESSVQIGVGSTAVYEGLAFGLETYVYDCPGSSILQPLVDDGAATIISSADKLASILGSGSSSFDREYYFASGSTERACTEIERLANEGTPYRVRETDYPN